MIIEFAPGYNRSTDIQSESKITAAIIRTLAYRSNIIIL